MKYGFSNYQINLINHYIPYATVISAKYRRACPKEQEEKNREGKSEYWKEISMWIDRKLHIHLFICIVQFYHFLVLVTWQHVIARTTNILNNINDKLFNKVCVGKNSIYEYKFIIRVVLLYGVLRKTVQLLKRLGFLSWAPKMSAF